MSKFLLNLLLQFKNLILIRKSFYFLFLTFGPAGLPFPTGLGLPAGPSRPNRPGLRGSGALAKMRFLFHMAQTGDDAFARCHRQVGPTCQLRLPPPAGRSRPRRRSSRPPRSTPPQPRDVEPSIYLPRLDSLSKSLLNHPPRLQWR
jgi:hypothetical protein